MTTILSEFNLRNNHLVIVLINCTPIILLMYLLLIKDIELINGKEKESYRILTGLLLWPIRIKRNIISAGKTIQMTNNKNLFF